MRKKNGKSKKRSFQNKGNKKFPAWRLLLSPELWPSVLAAGVALFAVLNALHSAAKPPGNGTAFWSPEAVTLYEEAAVLITDLPLIGEYQLAKIMRNAIRNGRGGCRNGCSRGRGHHPRYIGAGSRTQGLRPQPSIH
jgi:hypothetical protein